MLLFVFFRFIVLMKVTHYILFFKQKVIHYILCQLYFFKHIFEQKFIALHLNERSLCSLLCFLGALSYLNKACVFFCVQNILIKNKIIKGPDNLNYYTSIYSLIYHQVYNSHSAKKSCWYYCVRLFQKLSFW